MLSTHEAERIMKETTEKELKKLNETIQKNPNLLKSKESSPKEFLKTSKEYLEFCKEHRNDMKHIYPNPEELTFVITNLWNQLPEDEKKKYTPKKTVVVEYDTETESDTEDSESENYISTTDLKIEKLEREKYYQKLELSNKIVEVNELTSNVEHLTRELTVKTNTIIFVKKSFDFLNTVFTMETLEIGTEQDVQDLKKYFLGKAQEFNKIEEQYNELCTIGKDVDKDIHEYFIPLVNKHFTNIRKEYDSNRFTKKRFDWEFYVPVSAMIFTASFVLSYVI